MESAVIVRVGLPEALEGIRQRCVRTAGLGVPAHVTLLFPFVDPGALTEGTRRTLERIASGPRRARLRAVSAGAVARHRLRLG